MIEALAAEAIFVATLFLGVAIGTVFGVIVALSPWSIAAALDRAAGAIEALAAQLAASRADLEAERKERGGDTASPD